MKTSRISSFLVTFALICGAAGVAAASNQTDPGILIVIESPGEDVSGIGLVQGFALSRHGAIDRVTWSVDGVDKGEMPYGGRRGDVEAAHPGLDDSATPGFATAWNYNHFESGSHEIVVRAWDDRGGYNEARKTFETHRFGDGADKFLRASDLALPVIPIRGLLLHRGNARGDRFNLDLVWSKASQQFVIVSIDEVCTGCTPRNLVPPTLDDAFGRGNGRVQISWTEGSPVPAYEIERRKISFPGLVDEPWEPVGIAAGHEVRFNDTPPTPQQPMSLPADAWWEYRIRALGPDGPSDYSNALLVPLGDV